ncbi:GatB/YqeY domain-containing protein [Nocardia sp. IFM 10818]
MGHHTGRRYRGRMSELKEKLRADMTAAMKAKDALRLGTLRMLLAAIQNAEVAGAQARELTDADVIAVLSKEAKKRNEAAVVYEQAGRGELAANERAEEAVIEEYLPTPLTEAEVADIADTAIADVAEQIGERPGMKQMGQVMKIATALAAGRADGSRISAAVKARL